MAVFGGSNISETVEVTPTKIGAHACFINPYMHEFFSANSDRLSFLMTMDYSPWSERENWLFLRGNTISKTEGDTPTKIGVHPCYINPYMHEFFELIPID